MNNSTWKTFSLSWNILLINAWYRLKLRVMQTVQITERTLPGFFYTNVNLSNGVDKLQGLVQSLYMYVSTGLSLERPSSSKVAVPLNQPSLHNILPRVSSDHWAPVALWSARPSLSIRVLLTLPPLLTSLLDIVFCGGRQGGKGWGMVQVEYLPLGSD